MAPNNTTPEEQRDRSGDRGAGAGLLIGGAVFVGVITACALVVSYHGLFQLAEYGGHEGSTFAHVFPATYALLLVMAFWVSYVLRSAPPRDRLWIDVGLIPLLILFAGAVMVARNIGLFDERLDGPMLPERAANVIVAVAPLAALLIAILLWITLRAHMRKYNRAPRTQPPESRAPALTGRRASSEKSEPETLKSRLLNLGDDSRRDRAREGSEEEGPAQEEPAGEDRAEEKPAGEDGDETERLPAIGTDGELSGQTDTDEAPAEAAAETGAGATEEPKGGTGASESGPELGTPAAAGGAEHESPSAAEEPEPVRAGFGAAPLPRRSPSGDNPIKRAATAPPVIPGAAAPSSAGPSADRAGPEFPSVAATDRSAEEAAEAEEGFAHQPPVGDPTNDEAEAPREERGSPQAWETARAESHGAAPFATVHTGPGSGAAGSTGGPEDAGNTEDGEDTEAPENGVEIPVDTASTEDVAEGPEAAAASSESPATAPTAGADEDGADEDEDEDGPSGSGTDEGAEEGEGGQSEAPETADDGPGGAALWEPPEDEPGGSILDDYVPPEWTPPEDLEPLEGSDPPESQGPPQEQQEQTAPAAPEPLQGQVPPTAPEAPQEQEAPAVPTASAAPTAPVLPEEDDDLFAEPLPDEAGEEPEPTPAPAPALDHDTGPTVRAAFGRMGRISPKAARPTAAPEHGTTQEGRREPAGPAGYTGPAAAPASAGPTERVRPAEPVASTAHAEAAAPPAEGADPERRAADPPRESPAPSRRAPLPAALQSSPAALERDARALEKRPMVLKPPRPPITDFDLAPPSQASTPPERRAGPPPRGSSGPPSQQFRSEPMRPEG